MLVGRGAIGLFATAVVARTLGATGRGHVVFVTNLVGLLAIIAGAATFVGLTRLRTVENESVESLSTAAVMIGVLAGGVLGLGLIVIALADRNSNSLAPGIVVLAGLTTISLTVWSNVSVVASLEDRIGAVTWTSLVGIGAYLVVTAITAATGSMTVANNIAAWMFTSMLPPALLVWPARAVRFSLHGAGHAMKRLLALTMRANIATTSILAMWRIDQLVVGLRRGYTELGLYSIAVAVAEIVWVGAPALRSALLPQHSMSGEVLADGVARVTRVALLATVVASAALAIVGYPFLDVFFGARFEQTYPTMLILLPGVILLVLHYPLFDYIAARRGLRALTVMGIAGVVLNVGLDYALLGRYSYVAAAWVSTLTYAFVFATCLALFVRQSGKGVADVLLIRRRDFASILKFVRDFGRRLRPSVTT